jgi:hypothetical protein
MANLFDSFFGGAQKGRISDASGQAAAFYNKGQGQFGDATREFLDKSLAPYAELQPSIQQGLGAQTLLSNALGVNGPEAQSLFFNNFQQDPGFQQSLQQGVRTADMGAAARGTLRSGGQQRDLFNYGQNALLGLFQNRLAGLAGLGQQGNAQNLASVTGRSGLFQNAGSRIADSLLGTNQLLANNSINTGNAMASAEGIGINNLLGLGNLAASFINPAGSLFKRK